MRLQVLAIVAVLTPASAYAQTAIAITERDTTTTVNPGAAANFSAASYNYANTILFNTSAGTETITPLTIQPNATGIFFAGLGSTTVSPMTLPPGTTSATINATSPGGAGQGLTFGYNGGDDGFLSSGILGGRYALNFNGGGTAIVDNGGIFASTVKVLGDFSSAASHTAATFNGDYSITQNFLFSGGYTYFTVKTTNYQGNSPTISFSLLGAVAGVPEPRSWAMMILGFGMGGYALRRRRKLGTRVSFA